jgi:hypothetical protein
MASDMLLWNRVPADMLDRHPGLTVNRIEPHFDPSYLIRCEAWLAPRESKSRAIAGSTIQG